MMDAGEFFAERLRAQPVMAIFRNKDAAQTVALCERAWTSGVSLVEVPVQSETSLRALEAAVKAGAAHGRPVGAGTILTVDGLERAVEAGAAFTVAPGLDEDVIVRAADLRIPHLPGVATATEIGRAVRCGLSWLKAFPAAELGANWAHAQHGPFPQVSLIGTGGISVGNAAAF